MPAVPHPSATGVRSVLGLGLSVLSLALLHGVASSSTGGGALWGSSARRPDEVLVVVLAWVGMALAGWLALGSALGLLSTVPGALGRGCGRLADHLTPLLVRRVLTVALGTSTVSMALPPASVVGTVAAPMPVGPALPGGSDGATRHAEHPGTAATVPDPGYAPTGDGRPGYHPTPEASPGYAPTGEVGPGFHPTPGSAASQRADTPSDATPGFRPTRPLPSHDGVGSSLLAPPPRPDVAALDTVTVRRGDSLWSIAARHLTAGASDAEVARAWPRWFAANRAVIGEDPDLIRPGMQLVPPREGDLS
ncbi:MAG TPA: LysM domain-containing protein [Humibacillus xanthopallidus]|nr:LysM domain-containing protein [Humibacillus xanthopallidus]